MKVILEFLYTGELIEFDFTADFLVKLIVYCDFLMLENLSEIC